MQLLSSGFSFVRMMGIGRILFSFARIRKMRVDSGILVGEILFHTCHFRLRTPEIGEVHLGAAANASEIFQMLDENHACAHGKNDRSDDIAAQAGIENGKGNGCRDGNNADVVKQERKPDLDGEQYEKKTPVEAQDHSAEAGKSLAAAEFHIKGEDVPQHAGNTREGKCKREMREKNLAEQNGKIRLGDIQQGAEDSPYLAEQDERIGGTGIARALVSNVEPLDFRENVGGIQASDQVSD